MTSADDRKIVLITRLTRLEELVARYNTVGQARFYLEHLGADFGDYLAEHDAYRAAVTATEQRLSSFARVQRIERGFLANFVFAPDDLVVALGQDGLVANTLKYLGQQTLIGVNPDPARWSGRLLPFGVNDLVAIAPEALAGRRPLREVSMARASLNTGAELFAVNDLFIGARTHVSARYMLSLDGREERQSSSGIVVSTGLGSTGWLSSFYAGWRAAAAAFGAATPEPAESSAFAWDADRLAYFVREPFPSRTTGASLAVGQIAGSEVMRITSEMPENGVIFSDGIEADFLEFNAGTTAAVALAERRGRLVV